MPYKEEQIAHETAHFWVLDVGARGFEVYRKGLVCSTRVAQIGLGPGLGLERAIQECDRREQQHSSGSDGK